MKSKCIIVDIDGTVALMQGNRGPFEFHKVNGDSPNVWVIDIIKAYLKVYDDVTLMFLSGRSDECFDDTNKWLQEHFRGIDYYLNMRPKEQYWEKDAKVKLEMYRKHVEPIYDVLCVFDDRKQVVDMWRNALGLNVCQVAEGNF